MKLYHFTCLDYLESILATGISRGEVPITPTHVENSPWLTRDPDPGGQCWDHGVRRHLTEDERRMMSRLNGVEVPAGKVWPNKREIRLTVRIPRRDRNLVHWPKYARKRLHPDLYAALGERSIQDKWFIYRGAIPKDWIEGVTAFDSAAAQFTTWSEDLFGPDQGTA